tara:strand:- start:2383 stop:3288 length:906 start_codon:yes stop_codon:yes gene_type:complete
MISLIIPCIPEHLNSLEKILNDYISGTKFPDQTIISLSNTEKMRKNNTFIDYLYNKFGSILPDFTIILTEKLLNRADNRNKGIEYAKGDIITFSDADDRVHKQRIEIISYFFQKYDIDCLLHSFALKNCELNKSNDYHCIYCKHRINCYCKEYMPSDISFIPSDKLYNINYPDKLILPNVKNIIGWTNNKQVHPHHGFSTVKKKVLDKIKFNKDYPRGQDSLFCQEILYNRFKTILLDAQLMVYNNNWVPNINEYKKFILKSDNEILLDLGSSKPPYPAKARSMEEIKLIMENIRLLDNIN